MSESSDDKVTLTQRKAASSGSSLKRVSGSSKLKRSKIKDLKDISGSTGSASRVVIWVVIVIALASAAYLGLKTYLNSSDDGGEDLPTVETTSAPTPTPDPYAAILSDRVLPDDTATSLQPTESFTTAKKSVGDGTSDEFSIDKLYIQQYASFTRLEFTVSTEGDSLFPDTTAELVSDNNLTQIQVTLSNISQDQSGLDFDDTVPMTDSVIASVTHVLVPDIQEMYSLELSEETGFVLHTVEGVAENMIILDVLEPGSTIEEPVDTSDDTPSPTPVDTANDSDQSSSTATEFSTGSQSLTGTATGNTSRITKYNYFDGPSFFTYRLFADPFPSASASLTDNKLTVVVSNVASDGIVGNGGSGSTDFASSGAVNVNTVDISNSSNKSTYVFDLDRETEYRMFFDSADGTLTIEIKHN
ncbi:hypothetical protein KC909_02880 [Candidatus Dojkabacteria bacterium]|uniref:Uncharacterized protein n=1 Tax=Candidatus Dojkabacteria bacterium TaxID=2099670 RepID=A0A955L593_9BACT|nr:hypothetical protein [Candidatus Dojkabacteria bacterium]